MRFIGIIAMAKNRVIGKDGTLPWRIKEDLKFFKEKTTGGNVIMGRKTWEGMGVSYLNHRTLWVAMRVNTYGWMQMFFNRGNFEHQVNIFTNPNLLPDGDYWVAGGLTVYMQFMPHISEFYVTYINSDYEGDTVMPPFEDQFAQSEDVLVTPEFTIKRFYERKPPQVNS